MNYCEVCGRPIENNKRRCDECSQELGTRSSFKHSDSPKKKSGKTMIMTILIIVLSLCLCILMSVNTLKRVSRIQFLDQTYVANLFNNEKDYQDYALTSMEEITYNGKKTKANTKVILSKKYSNAVSTKNLAVTLKQAKDQWILHKVKVLNDTLEWEFKGLWKDTSADETVELRISQLEKDMQIDQIIIKRQKTSQPLVGDKQVKSEEVLNKKNLKLKYKEKEQTYVNSKKITDTTKKKVTVTITLDKVVVKTEKGEHEMRREA